MSLPVSATLLRETPPRPRSGAARLLGPLNPPIDDWRGKRVWIVGASSGIGRALAIALLARGATVAISARNTEALETITAAHTSAIALPVDVTVAESVATATASLLADWDRIDLVVWMAGTYQPMQVDDFDLGLAEQVLASNLGGPLNGLAALLPVFLRQQSGALALVGSVAGYSGLPRALAYGPSKAGLINLAESLYLELRPRGIGVYLINPGFVDTRLTARNDFAMPAMMTPQAAAQAIIAGLSRGRFEIHFPRRFTSWLKLGRTLPYRLYFAATSLLTAPGQVAETTPPGQKGPTP